MVNIAKINIILIVNQLLGTAIQSGVSDIHFEPFEDVFRVRYRIDGVLSTIEDLPYAQKDERPLACEMLILPALLKL